MKYSLLSFFITLLTCKAFCESINGLQRYSDSLYQNIRHITDREKKAEALLELSFFWSDHNMEKALQFIREAERMLTEQNNSNYYTGILLFYRAAVYFEEQPEKAKQLYLQAEEKLKNVDIRHKQQSMRYRARLWGSYGALLQHAGDTQTYVDILLNKVIPLAQQTGDTVLLGNNYQNVAMNLMNLQEYKRADLYYQKALDMLQHRTDAGEERLTLYVNAARNALIEKDGIKTKKMIDSAGSLSNQIPNSRYIPMYHSIAGTYWVAYGNLDKAHSHFEKGLITAKKQKNNAMVAAILFDQFSVFEAKKQHHEAWKTMLKVLPYVAQTTSLRNKQMVYHNLAVTASKIGRYKDAVKWYEAYKNITDSLLLDQGKDRAIALEAKYRTTEKENALLQLKNANQKQVLSLQQTRIVAGIFLFASTLLGVLSLAWYRSMKHRRKLSAQNELLLKEELKSHRQQEKLNLYNAMFHGEERERTRIARDLHDGLGGMLANVKMKLSAVTNTLHRQQDKETATTELNTITNQLDGAVTELRRIARNLMPESLHYMGLENALADLCKGMSQPHCIIDFQAANLQKDYPQSFLIPVYRIVQELLTNAMKHSNAKQIWVHCAEDDGSIYISVEDDGKGFDLKKCGAEYNGNGLKNICNRVELLNGNIEIDTTIGKGSSFHIQLQITK